MKIQFLKTLLIRNTLLYIYIILRSNITNVFSECGLEAKIDFLYRISKDVIYIEREGKEKHCQDSPWDRIVICTCFCGRHWLWPQRKTLYMVITFTVYDLLFRKLRVWKDRFVWKDRIALLKELSFFNRVGSGNCDDTWILNMSWASSLTNCIISVILHGMYLF